MADVCVARYEPAAFGGVDIPPFAHRMKQERLLRFVLPRHSRTRSARSRGDRGMFGSTATTTLPENSSIQSHRESIAEKTSGFAPQDDDRDRFVNGEAIEVSQSEEAWLSETSEMKTSSRYDDDVESLVNRVYEKMVIKDQAVQSPLWLHVPKGYIMEQAMSPTAFYKTRHEVRRHANKRKRALGSLPKALRRGSLQERHGFRAQEVNRTGAVHLEDCRSPNLTNTVHPLFDRSCFDDVPDAIYDQLIPGLQLATMFITQPICMQFWVTLAMGQRMNDPVMSAYNGKPCQRIQNHVELTRERASAMIKRIEDLGESKLIHFRFKHRLSGGRASRDVWGISDPICDYKGLQREVHGQQGPLIRSIIRLHADYYIVAKKLSQLTFPEVSQKLRFNFQFAVLIMHELTHSIEGIHIRDRGNQWIDWQTSRFYREPYWLDWQNAEHASELGRAWEETVFGGEIAPINDRIDGSHGISTSDWPPRGTYDDPDRRIWFTVSTEYIEHMFQMETWQRSFDLKQWRVFNIPRDGAISLYINSFTTMCWEEEARVADEEVAELIALENDQPAKKKRIVGEGRAEEHRLENQEVIEQAIEEQGQQLSKKGERQVLTCLKTRRHSLPVFGSFPNLRNRRDLPPRPLKPLMSAKASSKAHMLPSPLKVQHSQTRPQASPRARRTPKSLEVQQGELIEKPPSKNEPCQAKDELTNSKTLPRFLQTNDPTSDLIKEIKSRPSGLMDRYRLRKRAAVLKGQAERKRKREMFELRSIKAKEELMAASEVEVVPDKRERRPEYLRYV